MKRKSSARPRQETRPVQDQRQETRTVHQSPNNQAGADMTKKKKNHQASYRRQATTQQLQKSTKTYQRQATHSHPQPPKEKPKKQAPRPSAAQRRRLRERRRPLYDLVLESQLLYRRFMTRTIPKLLRELGVSSDSSDEDYM